jgi:cytochrome P450
MPRATAAPHVPGLPLLGSALQILRDPYGWWPRQYRRFGAVFRVTLPIAGRTWIAIAGRDANELLARDGARVFSQVMTYPRAPEVLGTTLHPSFTEGPLQLHLRRQVAPGFTRAALEPHLAAIAEHLRAHVLRWRPGQRINVTSETSQMGLDAVSLFATGEPLGFDASIVRRYATMFTGVIAMSWPMALLRVPGVRSSSETLDAMIERRLAAHRPGTRGDRPRDYFDFLHEGVMPDGAPLPERTRVVFGQIPFKNMGVYAGRVINHLLYQIVHRPEVLARVQPEIDRVFGGAPIGLADLDGMVALRATLAETLRILPVAVALQRTVCEPFTLGGHRFEPGDRVFTPMSATHFLEEHFPDPLRFDIDRFIDRPSPAPYTYNPFGLGHHACVARAVFEPLALMVVGSALAKWRLEARYRLRTIVDALPSPWPWHRMRVVAPRTA